MNQIADGQSIHRGDEARGVDEAVEAVDDTAPQAMSIDVVANRVKISYRYDQCMPHALHLQPCNM
jgi:hypothetical protein